MSELEQPRGHRLGIAVDGEQIAGALLDQDNRVVAVTLTRLAGWPTPEVVLDAVLDPLLAQADRPGTADVERVAFAVGQLDDLMASPPPAPAPRRSWLTGRGLVAAVRLGAATTAVPPLAQWPAELRDELVLASTSVAGGARLDGSALEAFDEAALVDFARTVAGRVDAVAVTGVFATIEPGHELAAAAILERELGGAVRILLSHEIGGAGLLERENATVLQAAMSGSAGRDAARLQEALAARGLGHAEVFFARNDGTAMALDYAASHPLALHGGTAAATVRGAALLAGEQEALVALTGTDRAAPVICAVTAGLPRLTPGRTMIAGVPTSLRMVARVPVRPGGDHGTGGIGGAGTVDSRALSEAVDRAKTGPADLPLLLGGPGAEELAAALPPRLTGTVGVRCPPWTAAAAAVGVATALVGGEAERIMAVTDDAAATREIVRESARAAAVRAGADPGRARVKLVEETPLSYFAEPAVALLARAEGPPRAGLARQSARGDRRPAAPRLGGGEGI